MWLRKTKKELRQAPTGMKSFCWGKIFDTPLNIPMFNYCKPVFLRNRSGELAVCGLEEPQIFQELLTESVGPVHFF